MDVKRSWGFISVLIGAFSLLWGCISLSGMVGQEQVLSDMGGFFAAGGSDFLASYNAEQAMAAARHKNVVILLTGIVLSAVGTLMMKGQINKF
ncbi:molybdenum cofactor biosynthesis protein [Photobacterium sagamiensis]|uniref:molybdenum cofactor biosynthesis protein n=1 Tax=Photobacterium sagamiensis TaxID=2910241 RepID=UPI003D0F5C3B